MFCRMIIPLLAIISSFTGNRVLASPVLFWSNANLPKSSVSLSTIKSLDLLSQSICHLTNKKIQLRLFIVNDLTGNQLQQNSENSHPILIEAKKPDSAFRYFPNVADDIYKTLSLAPQSNNFYCAHIHFDLTASKEFETLDGALDSMEVSINSLGSNSENTVVMALLSGPTQSKIRSRRSTESDEDIVISSDGSCMFYAKELFLRTTTTTGSTLTNYTLDAANSVCHSANQNSTGSNNTVSLNLVWYQEKGNETMEINMKMNITTMGSYWYIQEMWIEQDLYRYFAFGSYSKMDTPLAFSYVCTTANFVKYNGSGEFGQYDFNHIAFIKNFQFQPYSVKNLTFGSVNYCTSFFTNGIWMGITSSLLCLAILMFGVSRIMNVKSNDRLDDPKAKPLVIKAQE